MDIEQRQWVASVVVFTVIAAFLGFLVYLVPGLMVLYMAICFVVLVSASFFRWVETGVGPIRQLQRPLNALIKMLRKPQ